MSQPRLEIVKDEPDDLRAKLRKVIVHRDELLAKAADAQAAFDRSKAMLCEAAEHALSELLHRRPIAETPVAADTAALTAALARHDAMELAYREHVAHDVTQTSQRPLKEGINESNLQNHASSIYRLRAHRSCC